MTKKNKKGSRGFAAIIVVIVLMSLILIVAFSLSAVLVTKNKTSKNMILSSQSYYSSESGIEDGLLRVIKNYNYNAINDFNLDDSSINQNITQNGDITIIESLSSHFSNERKIKTELAITLDGIGFYYGVQVGEGGLTMNNNTTINGSLYSDGIVTGTSNTSSVINGDVFVATGMSLDRAWSVNNNEKIFGKNSPVIDVAQSFKPSSSEVLSQVSFYMKKNGNPSDKTIRLFTDNGAGLPQSGSPTKTEIASTTLAASKVGASYGWVDFSFSSPPSLSADQWYWIVIDMSESNSKYFTIAADSNNGNGNGVSKYTEDWNAGSPVWTEFVGDFNFKTWMGGVSTSLNTVKITGTAYANTINTSNVGVNAYAKNINNSDIVGDGHYEIQYTGGSANSWIQEIVDDPAVVALPVSDSNIADWEAVAEAGGEFSDATHCSPSADITLNASVLNCDFMPDAGIKITINGTVWVKGNIKLKNLTGVRLSSAYGGNSGVIIADNVGLESASGQIIVENNVAICGSEGFAPGNSPFSCNSSNGSYLLVLSTHEHDTTYAIDVSNNASGAIFYAHKGIANINNGANLKEVTAYKLNLSPNASVTYESGLASTSFTSGPQGGWIISDWKEIE